MDVTIRAASVEDAEAIAVVDLDSHRVAYRPFLGEDYLQDVTLEARTEHWRRMLAKDASLPEFPDEVLVAEIGGRVVAYSGIGASRDEDGNGAGEVFTLYVHPSQWRGGLGRRLLEAATSRLWALGYAEVTLWVLDLNERAQAFYTSRGWRPDGATEPARRLPSQNLRFRAPAPGGVAPGA